MNTQTRQNTSRRGLSLGSALKYLGRSAMELHRYRYIRTRMLHDSLDRMDAQRTAGRTLPGGGSLADPPRGGGTTLIEPVAHGCRS